MAPAASRTDLQICCLVGGLTQQHNIDIDRVWHLVPSLAISGLNLTLVISGLGLGRSLLLLQKATNNI